MFVDFEILKNGNILNVKCLSALLGAKAQALLVGKKMLSAVLPGARMST